MKIYKSFFLFFLSLLCFGCASKVGVINNDISYIKPPKWVVDVEVEDDFYAVGITSRKSSLKTATSYAKNNAVENLRMNIFVKLEDIFLNEIEKISVGKRIDILTVLNNKIRTEITLSYLNSIIRIDDMWQSPDSDVLYLRIFADKDSIISKIISILDEIKLSYRKNNEIEVLIKNIKSDIVYNNFKVRQEIINDSNKNVNVKNNNNLVKKNDINKQDKIVKK